MLFFSDGIVDARPDAGCATDATEEPFGGRRLADLLCRWAGLPPPEVVRGLTTAVVEHSGGRLGDDATAVCLDWAPGTPARRS